MKRHIKIWAFLLILVINLMILTNVIHPENTQDLNTPKIMFSIKADSPINIQNNTALAALALTGNGSASNPYILENYVINASGLGVNGIIIKNTDAYFILRNCTVTNAAPTLRGIWLDNVTHATITNNTLLYNQWGILLWESSYNTLSFNNASHNTGVGMQIRQNSDYNKIINNTLNDNAVGLEFTTLSDHNMAINNTGNYNIRGLEARFNSINNTFAYNTANHNSWDGLYLESTDNNTFSHNIAYNNTKNGIYLRVTCQNNTITDNYISTNTETGIFIDEISGDARYNDIINNTIIHNQLYGIRIRGDLSYIYHNVVLFNSPDYFLNEGTGNVWVENLINASEDFDGDGIPNGWEVDNSLNPWNAADASDDFDLDGITTLGEYHNGTNPNNPDTDGDGLNDSAEIFIYPTSATNPDTDGDGTNDGDEIIVYGTEPLNPDTDGDGMRDGWEIDYSLNPKWTGDVSLDIDGDDLTNILEYYLNTIPNDADSDDDLLPDGWEVNNDLDPGNISDAQDDFDADNLTNREEYDLGTDPNAADSDHDLLPDKWEVDNSLSPINDQDALIDIDVDGLTNLQEYYLNTDIRDFDSDEDDYSDGVEVVAGTDPLNPNSFPTESTPIDYTFPIILGFIIAGGAIAAAIIIHGLIVRSHPGTPSSPPKKTKFSPQKTSTGK